MKTTTDNNYPQLSNGIYAIAGICKNSGKTSLLNGLLASLQYQKAGVLTTGRDGEKRDVVFRNPKPSVKLGTNTLFTSTSPVIDRLASAVEILQKLPWQAGNNDLWLLKATRDIETEITGPANTTAQIQTAELMLSKGAEIVFIDGSLDRKSIALSPAVIGVFLVVGSSYGNLDKIDAELERLVKLSQIPTIKAPGKEFGNVISYRDAKTWHQTEFTSLLGNEADVTNLLAAKEVTGLYLPGAISDSVYNSLKTAFKNATKIIVRHPLNLQLNKSNLDHFLSEHKVLCRQPFKIIALAVNSWSVSGNHLDSSALRNNIRKQFQKLAVIDVREG